MWTKMWVDRDATTNSIVARKFGSTENIYEEISFQWINLERRIKNGINLGTNIRFC